MSRRPGLYASRSLKLGLYSSLIVLALPLGAATQGDEEAAGIDDVVDCGTMSLGALLLLEGYPAEPDLLLARLRPSSPAGPSLEELRDAAAAYGLKLRAVRLDNDERAVDRPMIVFFRRTGHGHFQVVRPVGHTGKLAEVIDPNWPPAIVDKAALFATPGWTGIALVPDRRPGWAFRIAWGLIGGSAGAGLIWVGPRLRRRLVRRSVPSEGKSVSRRKIDRQETGKGQT